MLLLVFNIDTMISLTYILVQHWFKPVYVLFFSMDNKLLDTSSISMNILMLWYHNPIPNVPTRMYSRGICKMIGHKQTEVMLTNLTHIVGNFKALHYRQHYTYLLTVKKYFTLN